MYCKCSYICNITHRPLEEEEDATDTREDEFEDRIPLPEYSDDSDDSDDSDISDEN